METTQHNTTQRTPDKELVGGWGWGGVGVARGSTHPTHSLKKSLKKNIHLYDPPTVSVAKRSTAPRFFPSRERFGQPITNYCRSSQMKAAFIPSPHGD